ncbi:glycosyl hydrolase family 7 protein [Aspergillus fischeri NRRL 181]|uniref:Glucanase n=1 Tax=Neosartorya fischeri (strain ATCC 1020 / DSM 3700 / CBS 544.65 / FGSC A1164 / JCM 1740 / NRRL 181 / WB 181) TaxID=331117 RepID=A1DAP8_NEOFI|nr:glycosyl hydrolase family 7 protein [Aspergillus fischeri NRRL 181]EAW19938.1 glycosyl hydrolase family 7 protein [Aspergillus fischeri NRRL 181]
MASAISFQVYRSALILSAFLPSITQAQQIGTYTTETHPSMTWETCTSGGSCATNQGSVVMDANWRWVHQVGSTTNCYTGNTWDTSICDTDETCATECAVDGADYESTYGVTTSGSQIRLNFVTQNSNGANVGSRLYMMADNTHYQMFKLLNQEFTFDVDVSNLPCGLNGALYFVTMDEDGGVSKYPNNKAGAQYGVGYCDSQCPRDLKFIQGQANVEGWTPSSNNENTGLGNYGSCCAELDIWESNSISQALTPHPCDTATNTMCTGDACGGTYSSDRYAGTCDPDGCDFNPYRMGNTTFYGPGKTIDTNSPFTVVTQFITDDGTDTGTLSEIRRYYVQNGVTYAQPDSDISGITGNAINADYCTAENTVFDGPGTFAKHGGFSAMSEAMSTGMVLVMSLWDDYYADMLWLDSTYPTNASSSTPGAVRGSCSTDSGVPATIESESPDSYVTYSNIKVGPIGSTFSSGSGSGSSGSGSSGSASTSTTSTKTTAATSTSTAVAQHYSQCGGQDWTGPTTCVSPYTCQVQNAYYSQCL